MGITYNSALTTNKAAFTSRARVTFTLTGETDGGLAFGASFRADNALIGYNPSTDIVTPGAAFGSAGSVFISGDFGRLTMGDTAGAAQHVNGHVAGVGLTGFGDIHEIVYLGNNVSPTLTTAARPTARYEYTIDGFAVAVSHTNPGVNNSVAAIGASYKFEGFTVGFGAERLNRKVGVNSTHLVASAAYSVDGISLKALGGQLRTSGAAKQNQFAISASGKFDEITVTAFGRRDFDKNTHVGIGGIYDLGGGASLRGGIVNTNPKAAGKSTTQADFGLNFSF
jgi:outer membrane protein OmpU